jgi:hypothetical protein
VIWDAIARIALNWADNVVTILISFESHYSLHNYLHVLNTNQARSLLKLRLVNILSRDRTHTCVCCRSPCACTYVPHIPWHRHICSYSAALASCQPRVLSGFHRCTVTGRIATAFRQAGDDRSQEGPAREVTGFSLCGCGPLWGSRLVKGEPGFGRITWQSINSCGVWGG